MGKDFLELPALALAQGAGLLNEDTISDLGFAGLIVSKKGGGAFHDFLETGVRHATTNLNYDGFVHRV